MFFIASKCSNIAARQHRLPTVFRPAANAFQNPRKPACVRAETAPQDDRRVFLTFPAVNAWKDKLYRPCLPAPDSPPAARGGVIGGVRGTHLFPLERRRTVVAWRRDSDSGICPHLLSSLHMHARTHASNRRINNTFKSRVGFYESRVLFHKLRYQQRIRTDLVRFRNQAMK